MPGHALLRQCDAHAARAGCLPVAMAEPLSVAPHAVRRAGPLLGKRVLVTGCGLIGALLVIAARRAGATEIIVTALGAYPPGKARQVGADAVVNIAEQPAGLSRFTTGKGYFDVLFEASGNQRALVGAFDVLKPRGIIVQVGLRGAFRFYEEFAVAVALLNKGLVGVKPLISATMPYRDAGRAFKLAADRGQAMKVLLCFE